LTARPALVETTLMTDLLLSVPFWHSPLPPSRARGQTRGSDLPERVAEQLAQTVVVAVL